MDQSSNLPRPSGIPRPATSRLPVLRPQSSQPQLRSPASNTQLRKKPSVSSFSRPTPQQQPIQAPARTASLISQSQPTIQRKSSRISLVPSYEAPTASRGAVPAPKPSANATLTKKPSRASLVPSSARRVSSIPSGVPPPRTSSQNAPAFKKPFARPPSRQSRTPSQPVRTPSISKEDDVLGSLNGFRSASRASSRAGSRAGLHESSSSPEYAPEVQPEEPEKRKSRPSLSERTMESLAQLPSSPANGKSKGRRSSFFNQDNSMPPPLRPASAMSNKSNPGRPTTSDGTGKRLPTTPSKAGAPSSRMSMTVPSKRIVSAAAATPTGTPSRISSISRPTTAIKKPALVPTQNILTPSKPRAPLSDSKGIASRTPKARPSVAGTFGQAISPPGAVKAVSPPPPTGSARKDPSSSLALRNSIAQAKAARKQEATESPNATPKKAENSSNALREQIAQAREAAKRNKPGPIRADTPPKDAIIPDPEEIAGFDFGLGDPFNQNPKGGQSVLRKRVDGARTTGRLNIAGMQLTEMPDEVLRMYDPNDTTVAWGEIMDVTTIVAADNELETLPDSMFPDVDVNDVDDDDAGPQFGGVQTLDFHGNLLRELPMGLRRLAELTKLNLSRNNLTMEALDVIAQIASLRELKLAENDLTGELSPSIADLAQLEVLDVANNKLISLPVELRELTQLRTFNVADNQLRSVPMELFTSTSLVDLNATKNRLEGTFFTIESAPHLQELRLSGNALTSLANSTDLNLPVLKYLDISANRMSLLPDVTSWASLGTLLLGDNKVTTFPEGFFSLKQLRIADFTANDISRVDERIALMEALDNLTLAANPIRERKFLTMSTDDMKRDLHARLQPEENVTRPDEDDEFSVGEQAPEVSNGWTVTPSGMLDLVSKGFSDFDDDALITLAEMNDIRQVNLQNNLLQTIPLSFGQIAFLTILDLSKNSISNPLTSPLELPKLRELRLSGNKLSSLTPLTAHLAAPTLRSLDISQNRLTGSLPSLHDSFPALITLIASDNAITDVPAESLSELKIVNLSNNNIERLDPRIGLHAGTLTSFIVEGNKFRVPNYQVLSKGTDAILSWLKDKIPRDSLRGRSESAASNVTRTTEGGSEFFDAEDGGVAW